MTSYLRTDDVIFDVTAAVLVDGRAARSQWAVFDLRAPVYAAVTVSRVREAGSRLSHRPTNLST